MNALVWSDVGFAYPGVPAPAPVLEGIELDVGAGDVLLVAGPSGSGKSTLLRTANGLIPHASGGRFGGTVTVFGRSTASARPRDLAALVGFVHQDPEAQFVVDRVENDLAFVLENLGVEPAAMRRRVEEVLDALGIAHLRDRSPSTLSGGEKQRCAIAGALAASPAALVLDEPTSQLDPQGADDVLAAVARLNADLGTTVVLAEHRLERAAPMADRAAVVESGRLTAVGPPRAVLTTYAGAPPVTHLGHLLGWEPAPLTVREARACARDGIVCRGTHAVDVVGRGEGEVLVAAFGLRAELAHREVLHGIDVEVREGEIVALLGRNGSGKTTLLRCLGGLLDPSTGRVALRRNTRVAYLPQDPNSLFFSPTVRRELAETLKLLHRTDAGEIGEWLARMGLTALADRHPRSLSGGERQRLGVAAIAVGGAPVLLLDEPTRGIDAESRDALERALHDHAAAGGAAVLATHDVELAARCATRAVVLGDGDVVAVGPARDVLAGSLFAPQVLRVLPPYLTVAEVAAALARAAPSDE